MEEVKVKIAKIILSIVTMLFALLGLLKVISFNIANPMNQGTDFLFISMNKKSVPWLNVPSFTILLDDKKLYIFFKITYNINKK